MKLMKISSKHQVIIYLIFSLTFIFFTNTFFNFDQSLIYGAADGKTYMQIAESSPNFSLEKEPNHKSQRFMIPYLVGLISFIFNIETFNVFRGITLILIILNLYILFKIFKKLNVEKYQQLFLYSLIIFNPYIVRYFLALPTLINDLVFIFSGTLLLLSFLENKKIYLFLSIFLASVSRINVVFFLIALIVGKFFFKKKFCFSKIDIFISIIIFCIIKLINNYHANITGEEYYGYNNYFFGILITDYSFKELIIFIFFPILNFLPLILIPFLFKIKFDHKDLMKDEIIIISFLILAMTVIISYTPGPIVSGKNIIRLINLSNPFIIFILFKIYEIKSKINFTKIIITLIFFITWSLHPTYSNINIFGSLLNII